jgi:hypothetical protein
MLIVGTGGGGVLFWNLGASGRNLTCDRAARCRDLRSHFGTMLRRSVQLAKASRVSQEHELEQTRATGSGRVEGWAATVVSINCHHIL